MKKPLKWVRVIAILYIITGILNLIKYFPFTSLTKAEFLVTGTLFIIFGIGIFKMKKWALYGQLILTLYDLTATLVKILLLKNYFIYSLSAKDYVTIAMLGFIGFLPLLYLWSKRKAFT